MALDFPNSPTIGDEFTGGGFTWVWTGSSWDKVMASVASGGNGFSLIVGASGNTTYSFTTPQPAGAYSFTSELADNTFDIYLISPENTNVGYASASSALEASGEFDRVVLYGATTNDIINFEFKPSASPATSGDVVDGAAPFLTSATPATLASIDDTTTVTGGNFASDVEIVFTGQDAVDRPAKNIVRSSSTSLIVTRPDAFPVEQEPFTMTATNAGITNPSTDVNKLTDYFDAGSGIVWVTTSPLPAANLGEAYSTTLEATDADSTSVVYSLTSGSLPTGLSLNGSTGVISGTPTVEESQTFTITATDAGGNSSAREFTLAVVVPTVEYLVIAGGGGAGIAFGGGGAGGYRSSVSGESSGGGASAESPLAINTLTNYTVTVGAGGAGIALGSRGVGGQGGNSIFGSITSTGGGGGGDASNAPSSGGSGGGNGFVLTSAPNNGTANQGFAGGAGSGDVAPNYPSGGGGGAGAVGQSSTGGSDNGGNGGAGVTSSITGSAVGRAGGGAGGNYSNVAGGTATDGGGNAGTSSNKDGADGAANTGGGGGAAIASSTSTSTAGASGSGGSGVVILRYSANLNIIVGAGLSSYTLTNGTNKVTVFTAGSDNVSFELATAEVTPVEFLVVAGGGGGGSNAGGGGGAGGYLSSISGESSGDGYLAMLPLAFAASASYTVTIGAGGAGSPAGGNDISSEARGVNGANSLISGLTSLGGGGGGVGHNTLPNAWTGAAGGSGGGGGSPNSPAGPGAGGRGSTGQGKSGGAGIHISAVTVAGSGGGGASAIGGDGGNGFSGAGGAGVASSVTDVSITYAGGGGGGALPAKNAGGAGGAGGGGAGSDSGTGGAGTANLGGGGGGGSYLPRGAGGNGGSGVVILRYPSTKTLTVGAGLTADAPVTIGANKVTVLTAGTGTVSLS